jgi:hypothetical protein
VTAHPIPREWTSWYTKTTNLHDKRMGFQKEGIRRSHGRKIFINVLEVHKNN